MKELLNIQGELKVPKGQFNAFGKYKYRSAEDILEAVKPLLQERLCVLILTDTIVHVGDRYYIEATATLTNPEGQAVTVKALAREEDAKKGMDASQITGTASSYARKYALNGLFAIDDTKDADATNTHGKQPKKAMYTAAITQEIASAATIDELQALWGKYTDLHSEAGFKAAVNTRKKELYVEKQ